MGNKENALKDYNKSIELDPANSIIYLNRGNQINSILYSNMGNKEKALEDYNKYIKLDPTDFKAYNNRGNQFNSNI